MSLEEKLRRLVKRIPLVRNVAKDIYNVMGNKYEGRSLREKYDLLKRKKIQEEYGYPRIIAFEPISKCILNCEFCILRELETWKHRRKTSMSFEEFKKIIDDIYFFTTDIQFSGGEPLINKDIFKMFAYARERNIYTLLATNGQLLSHRNNLENIIKYPPDRVLLSYEALDKSTYETIRVKGNYEVLLRNIKNLIKSKKESGNIYPLIILQMVLTKKNMHMEEGFWKVVKKLGADYGSIKALGIWPEGDTKYDKKMVEEYIIPHSEHPISRHEIDNDGNIVFFRKPGECPAVKHACIGSGGEVIPCWYIIAKTEIMGNATDNKFPDIWNSEKYERYRDKMINDWANPLCHRCIGVGATSSKIRF